MILVKDKPPVRATTTTSNSPLENLLERWAEQPLSCLVHHGKACCDRAQRWLLATDVSLRDECSLLAGPRWLRLRYKWGPTVWPISWCEAIQQKELDCGALAWMTREVFTARGIRAFPAQLIQRYNMEAVAHWSSAWNKAGASDNWLKAGNGLVYHEACGVEVSEGVVRIWDPSAGWWLEETPASEGYGSLAAIKLLDPTGEAAGAMLTWAGQPVQVGQWSSV
jgi:hypothetical protein